MGCSCCVVITKVLAAAILFITLCVALHACLDSKFAKDFGGEDGAALCESLSGNIKKTDQAKSTVSKDKDKQIKECPTAAIPLEIVAMSILAVVFVVSIVMIIMGICNGEEGMRKYDGGCHALAGIFIVLAGILMVVALVLIDNYGRGGVAADEFEKLHGEARLKEIREEYKITSKAGASGLAFITAIIYWVATCIICAS